MDNVVCISNYKIRIFAAPDRIYYLCGSLEYLISKYPEAEGKTYVSPTIYGLMHTYARERI